MKILEGQGSILEQIKAKTIKKGPGDSDFKRIMDQTLKDKEKPRGPAGRPFVAPAGGVEILCGTGGVEASTGPMEKKKIISAIQQTLDLVEYYAGKLGDPSISAQGMTPLVEHLEERMNMLRDVGSSPGLPEQLRPIISDLALTIGTEVAKFKRGDYA